MRKFYRDEEVDKVLENRRSAQSDEAVIEDFKRTEHPYHPVPRDINYLTALETVKEHFDPGRKVHPVSYPDLRYYPWPLSVSAEAPWTGQNFKFVPSFRDLDSETGVPKVFENDIKRMPSIDGSIQVNHYLKMKQKHGLIRDAHSSFHNLYNEIFQYNRGRVHQIKEGEAPFWDDDGNPVPYLWNTLHMRAHVVGKDEDDKIRAVFGATKLLLMVELMFIWPLQATYLNTKRGRMLWGREMSKGGWKKLFDEMHNKGPPNSVLGLDWKQFDKRLLHEVIADVHDIWRSYFDFEMYEPTSIYPKATPRKTERIERLWHWMCHSIRRTPILLPNGEVWEWLHNGFGSGFQQTQLMDSFGNAIMVYTCLLALGVNIRSKNFWALFQGDDSIIRFFERMFLIYGNNFLDMLADAADFYFNAVVNVKKSSFQDKVTGMTVLSYSNKFGTCWREEQDLLRHLYFPERPQDYGRLAASAVGLAMAGMGMHDRFYRLCEKIFTHITRKWHLEPKWSTLKWMVRAGMFETIEQLKRSEFPDRIELMSKAFVHEPRSESAKTKNFIRFCPRAIGRSIFEACFEKINDEKHRVE